MKGKTEVKWTEDYGNTKVTYHGKDKYFSIQYDILQANQGDNVICPGRHVYPFNVQIPALPLPSSFSGSKGKILYTLEAILSRSMRMDSTAKTEFTLIYRGALNSHPIMMVPQLQVVEKKRMCFSSGTIAMIVKIARTGFYQGEGMQVIACIQNKSSRRVKPKYVLCRKCSYFVNEHKKLETTPILKEVGDPIPPSTAQTVTRTITIPDDTSVSILNCRLLRVEYKLKVYLDVKYAFDPTLKFPIVILPALPEPEGQQQPSHLVAYRSGAFAN
ncbi:arrestin domain-containing protein 3-like [Cheilinus undulatus]|uniref:arrestin domain-containing protein 3-like n=1 Tax=Cheilinus undulatus TaxID=241271 RepID=UPI001BD2B820|nr:arrestin domain-containing protein 3-like [Cheilinus undulatus]